MGESYVLFEPGDKDIRIEYPELAEVEEFADLKTAELLFVWYYANRSSPFYYVKNDRHKISNCIYHSFGKELTKEDKGKYQSRNFPQKIRDAIERMEHYNPSVRLKAKLTIERIFLNLQNMTEVSKEMKEDMDSDLALRKQYVELSTKVAQDIPGIVRQLEEGFGIKAVRKTDGKDGKRPSIMDVLHTEDD